MDMQYTYSGTQNNGRITQSTDGTIAGGETVVYTYDTLNRLTKAETTSAAWGDAYTYDGFGNLTAKTQTKGTAPSMSASYDAATNHQVGQTYDANGNPGYNGTYPYDVENHLLQPLTSGTGPQWTYDGAGKRVFAKTPGNGTTVATTCEIYFYAMGQMVTTYQCGYHDQTGGDGGFWYQVKSRNVYFGGKLMRSAGVTVVTDRLGSVRANSNGERMSYFPYGEERTATADGREKFGTYFRDSAANGGLDYAEQRYYASAGGRFLTPDPYTASGGPVDPGSWNRYAYVQGDPLNFMDPQGRFLCITDSCLSDPDPGSDLEPESSPSPGGLGSSDDMQVVNSSESVQTGSGVGNNACTPSSGVDFCATGTSTPTPTQGGIIPTTGQPPTSFYVEPAGNGPRIRIFDPNGNVSVDIDYQPNHPISGNPHIHRWPSGIRTPDEPVPPGIKVPAEPVNPPGTTGPYSPYPRQPLPIIPPVIPPNPSVFGPFSNPCLNPLLHYLLPSCRSVPKA